MLNTKRAFLQSAMQQPPKRLALIGGGAVFSIAMLATAISLTTASAPQHANSRAAPLMTPPPVEDETRTAAMTPIAPFYSDATASDASYPAPDLTPHTKDLTLTVNRGDTLGKILAKQNISSQEAYQALQALKSVFDPRRLTPGQEINLSLLDGENETVHLSKLVITPEPGQRSIVTRQDAGTFVGTEEADPISIETEGYRGTIDSSLFAAGAKAGLSPHSIQRMIKLFSYDVDFQRDIRSGDSFEVMMDKHTLPDGTLVDEGDINFAAITLSGTTLKLYRYEDKDGFVDYYNEKGQSARKALLRTPVDGARISSGYGLRKHPILGYTKMHKGVDFATPRGTPVYAAGDGVIRKAKWWGGYGNYVSVRHNSTYTTAYAHLKRFAKGIHPGKRVRQGQIIAYSGNTGRSTGPHLHYEVLRNGHHVNPLRVKMPAGRKLKGSELRRFTTLRKNLDRSFAALAGKQKVAQASTSQKIVTR